MRRTVVIGGGITGQMVKVLCPTAEVYDQRQVSAASFTRMWGTNYLWEPLPFVSCHAFPVRTRIDHLLPTTDAILAYKKKIGKSEGLGSWGNQFEPETVGYRYTGWPELAVHGGYELGGINPLTRRILLLTADDVLPLDYDEIISTIPLPALVRSIHPKLHGVAPFRSDPIHIHVDDVTDHYLPDCLFVNYMPHQDEPRYRYCVRDGKQHNESLIAGTGKVVLSPGKIHPHPQLDDILKLLAEYGIRCFGRYGAWSSNELVHETWKNLEAWHAAR